MNGLMNSIFKVFFIIMMINVPLNTRAQNMDAEIQLMTDALLKWTQQQFELYGRVDQHKLDSMNNAIRLKQQEIAARDKQTTVSDSAAKGTLITVQLTQGGFLTVPEGKIWKVKRATCAAGMGEYNIVIGSVKFQDEYGPGERIVMPAFIPEASLLTEDFSSIIYTFSIIERTLK